MPCRPATDADVPAIAALRMAWAAEDAGADDAGDAGANEPDVTYLERFSSWWAAQRGQRRHWVAEVDAEAVGMASVVEVQPMPKPGADLQAWGYVHHVFVVPERRGQGIGGELMGAVVEAATASGYRRLLLHARPRAVPFYERLGFRADGEYLRLRLGERRSR